MRLKPGVLQWAAVACFCVGLVYALGIEGGTQVGQPITDGEFITAMVLILTSIALGRLSFALEDRQRRSWHAAQLARGDDTYDQVLLTGYGAPGMALTRQVHAVDADDLTEYRGHLTDADMLRLDAALRRALGV